MLGGMHVRPPERSVEVNGERRELQPRVMQVLVALAKARPSVLSRDRLSELCWEGRAVGDDALNRCILALRHLAQDFSPPPFAIETVPRVGHRLVENGANGTVVGTKVAVPGSLRWRLAAALLAFLLAAAGMFLWQQRNAEPDPASIAVLPFRNLSGADSYFAEGVGEEIMAQLAREPARGMDLWRLFRRRTSVVGGDQKRRVPLGVPGAPQPGGSHLPAEAVRQAAWPAGGTARGTAPLGPNHLDDRAADARGMAQAQPVRCCSPGQSRREHRGRKMDVERRPGARAGSDL